MGQEPHHRGGAGGVPVHQMPSTLLLTQLSHCCSLATIPSAPPRTCTPTRCTSCGHRLLAPEVGRRSWDSPGSAFPTLLPGAEQLPKPLQDPNPGRRPTPLQGQENYEKEQCSKLPLRQSKLCAELGEK